MAKYHRAMKFSPRRRENTAYAKYFIGTSYLKYADHRGSDHRQRDL